MPHGYECDRCETFVEQERDRFEMHDGHDMPTEVASVVDPDTGVKRYTLCEECRQSVVMFVEK